MQEWCYYLMALALVSCLTNVTVNCAQICEPKDPNEKGVQLGKCPNDTCCNNEICIENGDGYKCCTSDEMKKDPLHCSICPICSGSDPVMIIGLSLGIPIVAILIAVAVAKLNGMNLFLTGSESLPTEDPDDKVLRTNGMENSSNAKLNELGKKEKNKPKTNDYVKWSIKPEITKGLQEVKAEK